MGQGRRELADKKGRVNVVVALTNSLREDAPYHLTANDRSVVVAMARELTGTNIDGERHGVIFLNIQLRMEQVGAATLSDYLNFINNHDEEIPYLLSSLTIHTTGWFREPSTFDLFQERIQSQVSESASPEINLLSIGCSTGEEVFSYAFVLEELRKSNPRLRYSLKGIDIDPISLKRARSGVYENVKTQLIDPSWRHLVERRIDRDGRLRIEDSIMERVTLQSSNVLAMPPPDQVFDVISVRNILIYFDPPQLSKIMETIRRYLKPSGLLFTGVSETQLPSRVHFKSVSGSLFVVGPIDQSQIRPSIKGKQSRSMANPVSRLVIIEDEPDIGHLYRDTLEGSFGQIDVACTYEDGLKLLLGQGASTFVIADYMLACGRTGLDLMEEAKAKGFEGGFVLISAFADQTIASRALALGCKDVIAKPCLGPELLRTVRQHAGLLGKSTQNMTPSPELIALGSSTGGTEVLIKILENLPQPSPPVAVVQHIVTDFAADFAKRLAARSGLILGKMEDGEVIKPGHLYMALGDYHIGFRKSGGIMRLTINKTAAVSGHRPSVDFLFDSMSLAKIRATAILLTGMGRDGASGMARLHEQGCYTMAQDQASSIVFGMPGEAIKLGAAEFVGNPRQIQEKIHQILQNKVK
jgi:two-component system chemotaxis response regulator CheB